MTRREDLWLIPFFFAVLATHPTTKIVVFVFFPPYNPCTHTYTLLIHITFHKIIIPSLAQDAKPSDPKSAIIYNKQKHKLNCFKWYLQY